MYAEDAGLPTDNMQQLSRRKNVSEKSYDAGLGFNWISHSKEMYVSIGM